MSNDPICGSGGSHVVYAGAAYCARCGVALPSALPADWSITASENAVWTPAPAEQGRIVAWTAARNTIFAVLENGDAHRLATLDEDLGVFALAPTPNLRNLVCPPVSTRRGIYLIYPDAVHGIIDGKLAKWPAPDGASLTGAASGNFGELWVAAVDPKGGLAVLPVIAPGGRNDRTTRIPGFNGDPNVFLTLAVRSSGPFETEILIWGHGKVAVVVDRAVPILRRRADAPSLGVLLQERRDEGAPILAQNSWESGDFCLVPTQVGNGPFGVALASLSGGNLAVTEVRTQGTPVLGAALTASGRLFRRHKGEVVVHTQAGGEIDYPLTAKPADRLVSAQVWGETALFQEMADPAVRWDLYLDKSRARVLTGDGEAVYGHDGLLPPIIHKDALWWFSVRDEVVGIARSPLTRAEYQDARADGGDNAP